MKTKILIISLALILGLLLSNVAAEEFEVKWKYPVKEDIGLVYVYDLDNDGKSEIIAVSSKIYIINGDGKLVKESLNKIAEITGLQVLDLNGDGVNEIIISAGNRVFNVDVSNLNIIKERSFGTAIAGVSTGNVIGDDKPEVVVCSKDGYVFVLDDKLATQLTYDVNKSCSDVYVDDFDNDGKNEIVTSDNGMYMIDNFDTPTRTDDIKFMTNQVQNIRKIYVYDLNSDGVKDILIGTFYNVYGVDKDGAKIREYQTKGEVYDLKVADLDNDNKNEVVIGANTKAEFSEFVYAFDALYFNVKWKFKTEDKAVAVEVSDLNNDGRNEVVAGSYDKNVYVLDNKGNLLWKYTAGNKINSIYVSDLDLDGNKEIIAGSSDGNVYVFSVKKKTPVEGGGKNETVTENVPIENINEIYVADLDDDGKNEIAVGYLNYVSILDRNFNLKFSYKVKGAVNGIYIGDMNNDTYKEVAASDYLGNLYIIGRTGYLISEDQTSAKINDLYPADIYNNGSYEDIVTTSLVNVPEIKVYCTEKCCPDVDPEHIPPAPEGFIGSGICALSGEKEEELEGEESTVSFSTDSGSSADQKYRTYMNNLNLSYYEIIETKREGSGENLEITLTIRTKPSGLANTSWEIGSVYLKGSVRVFDGKNLKWKYEIDATMRTVFAADVNNDNYSEIIAGADDNNIYVINKDGGLIKKYKTEGIIRDVFAADINNDNYPEIIAGSDDWSVHVFNINGTLWNYDTGKVVYGVFAADLDNDGSIEVICGSRDNYLYILDSSGNLILRNRTEENVRRIFAADIDNDGYREVLLAGEKISVLNFDYSFSEKESVEIIEEIPEESAMTINVTENLTIINVTQKVIEINVAGGVIAVNADGNLSLINATENITLVNSTGNMLLITSNKSLIVLELTGNVLTINVTESLGATEVEEEPAFEPTAAVTSILTKLMDAVKNNLIIIAGVVVIAAAAFFIYRKRKASVVKTK